MNVKVVLAGVLLALAGTGHAQLRTIPDEAKRGEIRHLQEMVVAIDGTAQRLSPGAQVRDAWNRVILPSAIPEGSVVRYLLDKEGLVHRVWILTPQEAAKR